MSARKAVEQELTQEQIIHEARKLFVTKGYHAVSMRSIAKELGYSHGAIYYHFKDKAELFHTMVKHDFAMLDDILRGLMTETTRNGFESLKKLMLAFIKFGLSNPYHYEVMFLIRDSEIDSKNYEASASSYEKFASAFQQIYPDKVTPAFIWSVFLSLHGMVAHYVKCGTSYDEVEELAKSHVKFLLSSLP